MVQLMVASRLAPDHTADGVSGKHRSLPREKPVEPDVAAVNANMVLVHQLPANDLQGVDEGCYGPFLEEICRPINQATKDNTSEVLGQKRTMPGKQKKLNRHQNSLQRRIAFSPVQIPSQRAAPDFVPQAGAKGGSETAEV
jgi:hypothetical protein